jgi:hypothetical protein
MNFTVWSLVKKIQNIPIVYWTDIVRFVIPFILFYVSDIMLAKGDAERLSEPGRGKRRVNGKNRDHFIP